MQLLLRQGREIFLENVIQQHAKSVFSLQTEGDYVLLELGELYLVRIWKLNIPTNCVRYIYRICA
jgi:hypothetical protein